MAESYRLSLVSKNGTNPAYQGARVGAERIAARYGGSVEHFIPEIPDSPELQEVLLREAIAGKPDALLTSPAHPSALDPTLATAEAAGIPTVFFVSESDGVKPRCFVTSDNYQLAYRTAERLIAAMDGSGAIFILEGSPNSSTSAPRTRGFLDAIAAHPGITLAAQRDGRYQKEAAARETEAALADGVAFDGVLAANDYMAMGVFEALDAAGQNATVAAINATPQGIEAIKQGRLLVSAAYNAMALGCIATEAALRILRGETVPEEIVLPVEIVDASNCALWDRPYEDRPAPDWDAVMAGEG
jgi:ribose transport system substrate-binding protein